MSSDDSTNSQSQQIGEKVKHWLNEQGYPTEFKAAHICGLHHFRVFQGEHVRHNKADSPREIDVLALADHGSREYLIRIEHVLECKWSRDKPWIVFTSHNEQMAPSACAAQTIGNLLGAAAILKWPPNFGPVD